MTWVNIWLLLTTCSASLALFALANTSWSSRWLGTRVASAGLGTALAGSLVVTVADWPLLLLIVSFALAALHAITFIMSLGGEDVSA